MKQIEIIVRPTGELTVDAVGFKGADCEQATQFIEDALGRVQDRRKKPEYHVRRTARKQQVGR